jgi:transposase
MFGRYTHSLQYTRKRAYRTVRHKDDHKSQVESFCREYLAIPSSDVISIDKAGFYIGDTCRRGYSERGKRLNIPSSRTLRMSKLTLIAAVLESGIVHYKILDHNCKKTDFIQFVSEINAKPGTVAILDNIQFHHSKETMSAFRSAGIRPLFVPPYSPEFNAIENIFSMLKRQYRRTCPINADEANAIDYYDALHTIMNAHDKSTLRVDFSGYFRHVANVSNNALLLIHQHCLKPERMAIDQIGYKQ